MGENRRAAITMTDEEIATFLDGERTVVLCTMHPDGSIHAVPMWFLMDGPTLVFSAKSKSQKVLNARRDGRATILAEAGFSYYQLRGVEMVGRTEVIDDMEVVSRYADELSRRYESAANSALSVAEKARNRSIITFTPTKTASWNHAKLLTVGPPPT